MEREAEMGFRQVIVPLEGCRCSSDRQTAAAARENLELRLQEELQRENGGVAEMPGLEWQVLKFLLQYPSVFNGAKFDYQNGKETWGDVNRVYWVMH